MRENIASSIIKDNTVNKQMDHLCPFQFERDIEENMLSYKTENKFAYEITSPASHYLLGIDEFWSCFDVVSEDDPDESLCC